MKPNTVKIVVAASLQMQQTNVFDSTLLLQAFYFRSLTVYSIIFNNEYKLGKGGSEEEVSTFSVVNLNTEC